jgi:lipoprotein-releasing system permease protein
MNSINFKMLFAISYSLLLARWKQTLVAAVGVTFGITMFIAMLSFMSGLNDLLDGLVLNRTPHIRLFNEIKPNPKQPISVSNEFKDYYPFISSIKSSNSRENIYNAKAITQHLDKDSRVLGFTPRLSTQAFIVDGNVVLNAVINGLDVEKEKKLFVFDDYIVKGNSLDLKNTPNSIILGIGLVEKLYLEIGDMVQITTAKGDIFMLKVVGIFQSGLKDYDKVQAFVSINNVQKFLGKPNDYYTDINIKLHDLNSAPEIAKEYTPIFGTNAEDIQTANSQFETGSFVRTIISYTVGVTLLIVAGFGIYNILNMMIYEKMDSIAILKATGFSGRDVNLIFIIIALSIGVVGGTMGLVFGFGLSFLISLIPFNTSALPTITTYPVSHKPVFYIIGIIFSFITTYFAGLLPANKASKIDPVIIIRGK